VRVATAVEAVRPPAGSTLAGGGRVEADEVVTAVGVRPAIGWLEGSGVRLDNGVAVDAGLRTFPARCLRAAGDCAAFESRRFGRRMRVEQLGRGPAPARG